MKGRIRRDCRRKLSLLTPYKMIQDFYLLIKNYFNSNDISDDNINNVINEATYNLNYIDHHTHRLDKCRYPNIIYHGSYKRYLIYIDKNNEMVTDEINVPVYYCPNCEHYHAILPNTNIIPYVHYSLSFILSVLNDHIVNGHTINQIIEDYQISVSNYYRWYYSYKCYMNIYIKLRNNKNMSIFTRSILEKIEVINDIYSVCGSTLLQKNCRLFKQTK